MDGRVGNPPTHTLDNSPTNTRIMQITVENARTLETVELTDVLFGEVWLCSGQSNMQVRCGCVCRRVYVVVCVVL